MSELDPDSPLARLLALGVPYHIAVEALASTNLDKDETQALGDGNG